MISVIRDYMEDWIKNASKDQAPSPTTFFEDPDKVLQDFHKRE